MFKGSFLLLFVLLALNPLLPQAISGEKIEANYENFAIIGDTGKQSIGQRAVADSMKKFCEDSSDVCDAAILLGDNIYPAGMSSIDDPILDIVFKDYYQDLKFPFYAILGNHDYGKYMRNLDRALYQLEYSKRNPQFIMPARFYIKVFKHAVVAFLDTTRMMWKKDFEIQAELIKEAKKTAVEKDLWFFVAGHHPLLSNGEHGNAGNYERLKFPYFISGKHVKKFILDYVCPNADVFMSGHDHSLQAISGEQAGCKSYLIVSGAGGSASDLEGSNATDFETSQPGFFHFKVSSSKLEIKAIDTNADVIFTKSLVR